MSKCWHSEQLLIKKKDECLAHQLVGANCAWGRATLCWLEKSTWPDYKCRLVGPWQVLIILAIWASLVDTCIWLLIVNLRAGWIPGIRTRGNKENRRNLYRKALCLRAMCGTNGFVDFFFHLSWHLIIISTFLVNVILEECRRNKSHCLALSFFW